MNILVTAGNTQTPIDQVRCITNIFTGRTGARIALTAHQRGHAVHLLTSHPEVIGEMAPGFVPAESHWRVQVYRTYDDLRRLMAEAIPGGGFDAVIHCAAVSDYELAGALVPSPGTAFDTERRRWQATTGEPSMLDVQGGKLKSQHPELWLRLVPTAKLVDQIRKPWGFHGVLVKFKLEVGVSEAELHGVAERARLQSRADLMCANTLEGMKDWAILGPVDGGYVHVKRGELAGRLLVEVERVRGS